MLKKDFKYFFDNSSHIRIYLCQYCIQKLILTQYSFKDTVLSSSKQNIVDENKRSYLSDFNNRIDDTVGEMGSRPDQLKRNNISIFNQIYFMNNKLSYTSLSYEFEKK